MLLNNVESDLKTRLEKEGITQKELAGQIGVSLPYVNRIIRGREQLVNKAFLKMMDELGYDVELIYKKNVSSNASTTRDSRGKVSFRTTDDTRRAIKR